MKKNIIIVGATSGIGREVARILAGEGWKVGAVGRREELLESLKGEFEDGRVLTAVADVTQESAVEAVSGLAERMGGMDVFFLSSGIGSQNANLDVETEMRIVKTNCEGFTRMTTFAFNYFKERQRGGGDLSRYEVAGVHLRVVAHAAQQVVGDARSAARAARYLRGAFVVDVDADLRGGALHDLRKLRRRQCFDPRLLSVDQYLTERRLQ